MSESSDGALRPSLQIIREKRERARTQLLKLIEEAVLHKRRCPKNQELAEQLSRQGISVAGQTIPGLMRKLVQEGRLVVRIYGNNWRDIEICEGPLAGRTTLPPPHGGKPHTVLDRGGRNRFWNALD